MEQPKKNLVYLVSKTRRKSLTLNGQLAKHYFHLLSSGTMDESVMIIKYILVRPNDKLTIQLEDHGFSMVKEYKGRKLYRQVMSFRMGSLQAIYNWLDDIGRELDIRNLGIHN